MGAASSTSRPSGVLVRRSTWNATAAGAPPTWLALAEEARAFVRG